MRSPGTMVRLFSGLVLTAGLGSGLVESHASAASHSPRPSDEPISVEARHAGQSAHFESSRLERRHACAACLLRTETRAAIQGPALPAHGAPARTLARLDGSGLAAGEARHRPPARAPPLG